jgi:hypothetical protein
MFPFRVGRADHERQLCRDMSLGPRFTVSILSVLQPLNTTALVLLGVMITFGDQTRDPRKSIRLSVDLHPPALELHFVPRRYGMQGLIEELFSIL